MRASRAFRPEPSLLSQLVEASKSNFSLDNQPHLIATDLPFPTGRLCCAKDQQHSCQFLISIRISSLGSIFRHLQTGCPWSPRQNVSNCAACFREAAARRSTISANIPHQFRTICLRKYRHIVARFRLLPAHRIEKAVVFQLARSLRTVCQPPNRAGKPVRRQFCDVPRRGSCRCKNTIST